MKTIDVTALGELLVDFTESGVSAQGNPLLEANPGGAPCNVLAMLAKLGRRTAFIGKVGGDPFGEELRRAAAEAGIDVRALLSDARYPTALAFVRRTAGGDRDFRFYRDGAADTMLRADEVPEELIAASRVFHFGSLSMTHPAAREATETALSYAKKHGCLVSFDPNLRPPLWSSLDEARARIDYGLRRCGLLKIADDELRWFTGREDLEEGVKALRAEYGIPLLLLTRGREGSSAFLGDARADAPAFPTEDTVDATGAGDCFCACALDFVLAHGMEKLREKELRALLRFANAAAALVTTRKGALRAMPTRAEAEALLAARAKE